MATQERRHFMALDDAYDYCRLLEMKVEMPILYKLCSALRTVDAAEQTAREGGAYGTQGLSVRAWSQVRDKLFDLLLRSFPGYFVVYGPDGQVPVEPGQEWPQYGRVEFFPNQARRRDDSYSADLDRLTPEAVTAMRWCFAEGRQQIDPADFPDEQPVTDEESEAVSLMERLYEICVEEATRGKKRAHERWWQLYWQSNSCADRKEKSALKKQMLELQAVWGRPS